MANRRPITAKTSEELISRLPGFKPAAPPKGEDGEPLPQLDAQSVREPTLPEFIAGDKWQTRSFTKFGLITRDAKIDEETKKPTKQWKEPVLPVRFGLITKDAADQYRQE